ncbi:MAG: putative toxin-antitoxin system toxin component, PIN family [Nitrospiraceae bacterium]|nr:putative toxin-antitoxin system toxin component, PIN family [Nitrospiraceae bacterium]
MKVVADTNVWVSAVIASSKTAGSLVDAWRNERFKLAISQQQLTELAEVFHREKFLVGYRFNLQEIADMLDSIAAMAERITLKGDIQICRDPDDNVIIETAVRGKAGYLITGDKDIADDKNVLSFLSNHGVTVISLSKFLALIGEI